ncbi:MAG: hypothetical protein QM760_03510 [Nibricoccus sp.]
MTAPTAPSGPRVSGGFGGATIFGSTGCSGDRHVDGIYGCSANAGVGCRG